ncbi:hypothetical protein MRX96_012145 [Rhipicephalus microplus]
MVHCSLPMKCNEEFPAADPDRSACSPTLQNPYSASVFNLKIPVPNLHLDILPSRSPLSEDMEALTPIVPAELTPTRPRSSVIKCTLYHFTKHYFPRMRTRSAMT